LEGSSGEEEDDEDDTPEPVNADKTNFVFGMHPLNADDVVIDPKYPPQFYPYLYPHLFPHLFPKLYPHYAKAYKAALKKKKKSKKHESRPVVVVLPDGRNIKMTRGEFLAYQLALGQSGVEARPKDITEIPKNISPSASMSRSASRSPSPSGSASGTPANAKAKYPVNKPAVKTSQPTQLSIKTPVNKDDKKIPKIDDDDGEDKKLAD
jgi:hypothetical protein